MLNLKQVAPVEPTRIERPARALVGWMTPSEALLMLTGRRQDRNPTEEQKQLADKLRAAVVGRLPGIDQTNVVVPPPEDLSRYIAELEKDPSASGLLSTGWNIGLVDLRRVCAAQPVVHVDHAEARVADIESSDIDTIASITLPMAQPIQLPAMFDPTQKAWILTSANPNLRLTGAAQAATPDGAPLLGFTFALLTSFVRVARYRGRYILVDGYHRAHGFLRRGIVSVPAFVTEVASIEALGLPGIGMLPQRRISR